MALPTNRSTNNSASQHVTDHNTLHEFFNEAGEDGSALESTTGAQTKATAAQAAAEATAAADATTKANAAESNANAYTDTHEARTDNPHSVTKSQIGLANADNTSDADKPVSTAQATAIGVVQTDVDTHEARTDNPHGVTKTQVGLANVTNDAQVPKSLFDAQSLLVAVTDDTPVALTVAEQTLLGRITGGSIDDLSVAQVLALLSVPTVEQSYVGNLLDSGEEIFPRDIVNTSSIGAYTSGQVGLIYFTARKTEAITQIKAITGGTAAGATPTLCRMGVYSVAANGDLTLLAACANDTSLFAATNTTYTRSLTSTLNKVKGQRYAFAYIIVSGAAIPTFVGNNPLGNAPSAEMAAAPRLSGTRNGQTDLPGSITEADVVNNVRRPWGVVLP